MPTTFTNDFSREVFEQTYRMGSETIDDAQRRVATYLASIESNPEQRAQEFLSLLENFKFVPGGRISSNAGLGLKSTTMINCFVSAPGGEDIDSMDGIHRELGHQMSILKSEGGYGFCASFMRPRGAFVSGIANHSPGAVEMLNIWDASSSTITAGAGTKKPSNGASSGELAKGKIRKGAQMVTMHVWHPDVSEFITAKQTPGRLTKFNMSVLLTDEFMKAVKAGSPWNLVYPDYVADPELYKTKWTGDLDEWKASGGTVKIYRSYESAGELYDEIMKSTYNRSEPGVMFIDTANKMNNLWYCERFMASNPCIAGDTWVMTSEGPRQVTDLIGTAFTAMIDGNPYYCSTGFWMSTDREPVYKIETKRGYSITATGNHRFLAWNDGQNCNTDVPSWLSVDQLHVGSQIKLAEHDPLFEWDGKGTFEDGYLLGHLLGDGHIKEETAVLCCWEKDLGSETVREAINGMSLLNGTSWCYVKSNDEPRGEWRRGSVKLKRLAETYGMVHGSKVMDHGIAMRTSSMFYRGFIRGLFDTDGTVTGSVRTGITLRLAQTELSTLILVHQMLIRLGMTPHLYKDRLSARDKQMPDGRGGQKLYHCKTLHEIHITSIDCVTYKDRIGFFDSAKMTKLTTLLEQRNGFAPRRYNEITSITQLPPQPVYDCTVDEVHKFEAGGFVSSNCSEQLLPNGGVCLLGSFNLTQFVNSSNTDFDYPKLEESIKVAVRMLDNVNDLSNVPLPIQKQNMMNKRRIGMGVLGYGSALYMMKLRYGSPEALEFTERFMKFYANAVYNASVDLAIEKGAFPLFDAEKYLQSRFIQSALTPETQERIRKHGIRNSHLLSIQPTGNTAIYANNVSGGLEPLFSSIYYRTTIMPEAPPGLHPPKNVDWTSKKFQGDQTAWRWKREGDESMLYTTFDGYTWKFDKSRGLLRETELADYAVLKLRERNEWDPSAPWAVTAETLTIDDHVNTMTVFSRYIDSSMSKTINVPHDYPYRDFKKTYMMAYDTGSIKGVTTYRAGTMATVLSTTGTVSTTDDPNGTPTDAIVPARAPVRPKELPCDISVVTYKQVRYVVLVGLLKGAPFEVFAFREKDISFKPSVKTGSLVKTDAGSYNLITDTFDVTDIGRNFNSCEESLIARLISLNLKNGVDINAVYRQLSKSNDTIASFSRVIARTLSKYVTHVKQTPCGGCQSPTGLVFTEGCMTCKDCGWSKCG